MKSILASLLLAASSLLTVPFASAGSIGDNYIGAGFSPVDVIGKSTYDIAGATIARIGSVLTITIATNFAGHAGMDSNITPGGIGYGDLFLAQAWNPAGTAASSYSADDAAHGTKWSYGFALDNNFSNTGGTFKLMQLNGTTNASNIINSNEVIKCNNCDYRKGQATLVNDVTSKTVKDTGLLGSWSVTADKSIQFTIDVTSSDLLNFSSFAMHWGETCQNDVIEGVVRMVPIPGTLPLLGLGLMAMLGIARRNKAAQR
ncbi:hypothetical protein [Massilia sp. S19_KUP03_FR1]|uniref:hypothetical protein n=1 Tax=Massilia sp. S19_KUP03_FR1 TaxID=3025503 RepID=UPI002FCD09BA